MDSAPPEFLQNVASYLSPPDWFSCSCVGHVGLAIAHKGDWQLWCQATFGRGCLQYMRFLDLEKSALAWHRLYLRLKRMHHRLHQREPLIVDWAAGIEVLLPTCRDPAAPCMLQDGHGVIFRGDLRTLSVFPVCPEQPEQAAASLPMDFLDVVPLTRSEVLAVTQDLHFERWVFKSEGNECMQRKSHLKARFRETPSAVRLFVEHVACRVFIFSEGRALAFELSTLDPCYEVSIEWTTEDTTEVLARWDYGHAFLVYKEGGKVIQLWQTAHGSSLGCVESNLDLICCDLTRADPDPALLPPWHEHTLPVVAALAVDGRIRLYRLSHAACPQMMYRAETDHPKPVVAYQSGDECQWQQIAQIPEPRNQEVYVEVKLEGHMILAISHLAGESGGSVHLWDLCGPSLQPMNKRRRCFPDPPDRIEARHGGAFIEVCFAHADLGDAMPLPAGVFDVMWLDPRIGKKLVPLLCVKQSIGDWRCDVRDWVSAVKKNEEKGTLTVVSVALWPPLT